MEEIKYYIEKYKREIIFSLVIIILLVIILCMCFNKRDKKVEVVKNIDVLKSENIKEKEEEKEKVKVDVKGAVVNPGVYEFEIGSRVIDAINKAGGLFEYSNTEYLNLSKKLVDEMLIIVYTEDQVKELKKEDKQIIYVEKECICPDNINDACINKDDVINTNEYEIGDSSSNNDSNKVVSINTGTLEELMTLTGVGESKAKAIIEYREKNNGFKTLEEITNVSGIGESAYSKIKDNIKL